ncbi:MAG: DNA repair protein RecO [Prevotella sp.]|nr:DNA repair protein RecO [Prevotella sp.]
MLAKTEAIVLHTLKYGESKVIVDMFTKSLGRLSFVVSVPKTNKSRVKKQYFQPMTLLEITCEVRQRVQLQKLSDARLLIPYVSIPLSAEKLAISMFVAEFLYHGLRSEQCNEPLFDYIADSLQWLDAAGEGFANFHLTFLMRLSRFLGFYPNLAETPEGSVAGSERLAEYFDLREGRFCSAAPLHRDFLQPAEARLVRLLMRMDFSTMHLFQLSRHDRHRIMDVLLLYYKQHLPDFPEMKSLAVLQQLW